MSAHDHEPEGDHDADAHDDHDEPPPPEPASPGWLPLLGGALFLVGWLLFLLTGSSEPKAGAEAAPSAQPVEKAAPPAVTPSALLRPRRMPALRQPGAAGAQAPAAPAPAPGH